MEVNKCWKFFLNEKGIETLLAEGMGITE